jgi:hypothetical protein
VLEEGEHLPYLGLQHRFIGDVGGVLANPMNNGQRLDNIDESLTILTLLKLGQIDIHPLIQAGHQIGHALLGDLLGDFGGIHEIDIPEDQSLTVECPIDHNLKELIGVILLSHIGDEVHGSLDGGRVARVLAGVGDVGLALAGAGEQVDVVEAEEDVAPRELHRGA